MHRQLLGRLQRGLLEALNQCTAVADPFGLLSGLPLLFTQARRRLLLGRQFLLGSCILLGRAALLALCTAGLAPTFRLGRCLGTCPRTSSSSHKRTRRKLERVGRKGTGQWNCLTRFCGKTVTSDSILHADDTGRTSDGVDAQMPEARPPSRQLPHHDGGVASCIGQMRQR